jgi:hypothetical protein
MILDLQQLVRGDFCTQDYLLGPAVKAVPGPYGDPISTIPLVQSMENIHGPALTEPRMKICYVSTTGSFFDQGAFTSARQDFRTFRTILLGTDPVKYALITKQETTALEPQLEGAV